MGDDARARTPMRSAFLACERSLKRFIARLSRSDWDVDDIAHEALVNALKAEQSRAIEHPEAYLFRTARNLVIRKHANRGRDIIDYVDDAVARQVAAAEPNAEECVISRERFALFCEAVATLPPSCRRVFVMRKVYGYSHKEISERLGISTSTVEKHLSAGLARCAAFMQTRQREGGASQIVGEDAGGQGDRGETRK